MKLKFTLETLGWISCLISDRNGQHVKFYHSSDFGDKFQVLLNNLMFMREILINNEAGFFPFKFSTIWSDEISNFELKFSTANTESFIEIRIVETPIQNPNESKRIFIGVATKEELFRSVLDSLDVMLTEFGFVGYKKIWEVGNFPIAEYIELKSWASNSSFRMHECKEENTWKGKVSFSDEIKLLGH